MTLEARIKAALSDIAADIAALQQQGGGALPTWQSATVDLAGGGERRSVFVEVPGMLPTQTVEVQRSTTPAPGKGSDEHLAEPAVLSGFTSFDGFWLLVMAQGCTVAGPMNINFRVT
jgi:hypothetical protein